MLFLFSVGLTRGDAQLNTKRVTSIQLGQGSEGAKVAIVADSALNDYEAFRRGDRFYVRIPGADFVASNPGFRGDGFEDVHVQKVGDSIVISFKLQPGANARVDEGSNRLEVIFTSPAVLARNNSDTTAVRNRVTSSSGRSSSRNRDAAGPVPPGTPDPYSDRLVESANTTNDVGEPRAMDGQTRSFSRSRDLTTTISQKTASSPSPTPFSAASPAATPWTTYPATAAATPYLPAPVAAPARTTSSSFKERAQVLIRWVSANRVVTLIAGVVLLALVGFAFVMFVRRKRSVQNKRRLNVQRAQPKYSPEPEFTNGGSNSDEAEVEFFDDFDFGDVQSETAFTSGEFTIPRSPSYEPSWNDAVGKTGNAGAYYARDEQEREVFEL